MAHRVVGARIGPEPDRLLEAGKRNFSAQRSFWMIPKLSYIVIMNLIANLPFLYHKPEKAVTRID
jgi:hypothetical protein